MNLFSLISFFTATVAGGLITDINQLLQMANNYNENSVYGSPWKGPSKDQVFDEEPEDGLKDFMQNFNVFSI